jgi:ribonuclease HII
MKCTKPSINAHFFEKEAWKKNQFVCGIDEVGRGCLLGPLVCSAVILPQNTRYRLLKDSKVLTQDERTAAYEWIVSNAQHASAHAHSKEVDHYNIYEATRRTMHKAFISLVEKYKLEVSTVSYLLIDAMPLSLAPAYSHAGLSIQSFPFGESLSRSIAAASIVAKVERDRLTLKMEKHFPMYGLAKHKGYGTALHTKQLDEHGASLVHRTTFIKKFTHPEHDDTQQTLF